MKSYCENCQSFHESIFRAGQDHVTGEHYEDLICNTCAFIVATVKERLTQQSTEQEPVGWWSGKMYSGSQTIYETPEDSTLHETPLFPLYTQPQEAAPRKPLTDEKLRVIENKINPNMRWRSSDEEGITLYPQEYFDLVRAIEAAHGITGVRHG